MDQAERTTVSVLTARGMAAIASVALSGAEAPVVLEKVFQSSRTEARSGSAGMGECVTHRVASAPRFCESAVLHGSIVDGNRLIDEVLVGCEGENEFVIHCHGNPLLVEQIVKLCQSHGATLTDAARFAAEKYQAQSQTMIEAEAKQAMQTCATLSGAKIISNQLTCGLLPLAKKWLDTFDTMSLPQLWAQCHQVLRKTSRARFLINRCRIALIGPPNSGKSTLLNRLAGRDEVIVTDTAGTTRDWVKITCHIGPLLADIYDTAGLDEILMQQHEIDTAAQQETWRLISSADMNIFVYDVTNERQAQSLLFSMGRVKAIIAANKCDLLTPEQRQTIYSKYVPLSAQNGDGIDRLCEMLLKSLKVDDFDLTSPVCFTDRQQYLLRQILHTNNESAAKKHIETLLFGNNPV